MAAQAAHGKAGVSGVGKIGQVAGAANTPRGGYLEQADLIEMTMKHWPDLARRAGLSPDRPRVCPILVRQDESGARIILGVEISGKNLILKHEWSATGTINHHFAQSLAAQTKARLRLSGNTLGLKVPAVLASLEAENLVVMERLPGDLAAHVIEGAKNRRDRRAVLKACGEWLGAFHRSTPLPQRPYQPRFVLEHLRRQRSAITEGRVAVAGRQRFLALSEAVEASAQAYVDKPANHAWQHGDFSFRNVVLDATGTGVVDFKPEHTAPIGHDIARLLVEYLSLYGEHANIPDGQILQGPDRAAFFRAYGLDEGDDPSIRFLYGAQGLSDWSRIPADENRRSLLQMLRLEGLTQTMQRLYPALRHA
jgi:aminoglycoside phosphotransferase (APT) family kinase protein